MYTIRRSSSIACVVGRRLAAAVLAVTASPLALAQGALKPVDAMIVNPVSKPVPVSIVGAGARTHMGVPVADHVMLNWVAVGTPTACGLTNQEFRRYRPDGSFDNTAFVVPAGRTLVVTDLDAAVSEGNTSFGSGQSVQAALMTGPNFGSVLVAHATAGVVINSSGLPAIVLLSSSLGAGVLFSAGQQVCVRGDERGAVGFIFKPVRDAVVRGYLL
jgi:hypothetical protein